MLPALPGPGPHLPGAACLGVDPSLFYPERGESTGPAKQICSTCGVREACLAYALAHGEHLGIWGGTSERQRRAMRRGLALSVPASQGWDMTSIELIPEASAASTNGHQPEGTSETKQECSLEGCHRAAAGRSEFCSEPHRRKAARRRRTATAPPVKPQVPRKPVGMDQHTPSPPAPLPGAPFDQLASLAGQLPAGWCANLSAGSVTVTWSAAQ